MTDTQDLIARLRSRRFAIDEVAEIASQAADEIERLRAEIDRLMLEHCPGEMTREQVEEWAKHQRAARSA